MAGKYILDTPWLKVRREDLKFGDKRLDYYFLEQPNDVVVVPLLNNGKLILIDQYRLGTRKRSIEFPAGYIDEKHISPKHAAMAELEEEIGYTAGKIKMIGKFFRAPARSNQLGRIYLATSLVMSKHDREADEDIKLLFVEVEEVYKMAKKGKITDAGTLISLTFLKPFIETELKLGNNLAI